MKSKLTNRVAALEDSSQANEARIPPLLYIHGRPGPTKEEIQRSAKCPVPPLHVVFVDRHGKRTKKR
jgi:hypothetical protein